MQLTLNELTVVKGMAQAQAAAGRFSIIEICEAMKDVESMEITDAQTIAAIIDRRGIEIVKIMIKHYESARAESIRRVNAIADELGSVIGPVR